MQDILIIIDNGHGSDTPGKRSPKWSDGTQLFEWSWTREIAKLLKERFDAEGLKCVLLVPDDADMGLSKRAAKANAMESKDGKLLVSIHGNASQNGKAKGWEVWSTKSKNNSDKLAQKFVDNFKYVFGDKHSNRGHKENDWTLLFKVNCPAVLTENFFYDNEDDCRFMLSDEGKDAIVELHYRAIKEYIASIV